MLDTNTRTSSAFAPHNVAPEKKQVKEYGLMNARAIWYHNGNSTPNVFYNDRDTYLNYMKYAFGDQSSELYKPALHVTAKNQTQSLLGGIRWQNKNYATKRVQSTISKIFNRQYDPVASAIDPASVDRRADQQSQIKTWMEHQQWLSERSEQLGMDLSPDGVDMDALPINDEDLQLYTSMDMKLASEIATELGIQYHLQRLDFEDLKEKIDQYLTILPVAGVWCGLDESNLPLVKVLNPARILAPYSEFNNFKRIAYGAYIDDYTVSEFKRLVGTEFPEDKIIRIAEEFSRKGDYLATRYNADYPTTNRDVDKIQIMHFEVPTIDEYVYLSKTDKDGNNRFQEKDWAYFKGREKDFNSKYGKTRTITRLPKATVYGGYWIVGSDIVFGYGEKNYCKGELGYKLRASNMLNGYTSCLMKQMIPSLDNLETYDKKIQQLVASAIPRIIKIDLFALRRAKFKMNDKDMGVQDLIEMFFQTGVIVTDTSDMGSTGDTRKPIEVFEGGIAQDIVRYLELMRDELSQLDEIIGFNRVSSGATVSADMPARLAQQQDAATDTNLDHIFRADKGIVKDIFKAVGHLHRQSVAMNPDYYIPILGEEAVARIISSLPFDEIGIGVEARPTKDEWNFFNQELDILAQDGQIAPEDKFVIRRFKSLKQAQSYLRVITRRRKREKYEQDMALIDKNAQAQQASNAQTMQGNVSLEQMKMQSMQLQADLDLKKIDREHQHKMEEILAQTQLLNAGKVEVEEISGDNMVRAAKARPKSSQSSK